MSDKNKKYLQGGLVLSLILNGFLIGFTVSGGGKHQGPPLPPDPAKRMFEATDHLPPQSKQAVLDVLKHKHPEIKMQMQQGAKNFEKLRDVLTKPDLTKEDMDQIFAQMKGQHDKTAAAMDGLFYDLVAKMPDAQQRIKFFKHALPPKPPFAGGGPRPEIAAEAFKDKKPSAAPPHFMDDEKGNHEGSRPKYGSVDYKPHDGQPPEGPHGCDDQHGKKPPHHKPAPKAEEGKAAPDSAPAAETDEAAE